MKFQNFCFAFSEKELFSDYRSFQTVENANMEMLQKDWIASTY